MTNCHVPKRVIAFILGCPAFGAIGKLKMKKLIAGASAALMLASVAGAAQANSRYATRGEAGYELGCAFMWMLGYGACAELPNYPAKFKC